MPTADATQPPRPGPSPTERVTSVIHKALSPNQAEREAAFNDLYRYVGGRLKGLLAGCLGRKGREVQVTEAIDDAVGSLFVRWPDLNVADTGHFRALVVQAVYWKAAAQRRARRHLREAVTEAIPAPPIGAAEAHVLDRFEEAVEALAAHEREAWQEAGRPGNESPTPLADAVKARHLIGMSAPADEPAVEPRVNTFEAVGAILGIDPSAAFKRYWKALEWLHKHYPDLVPALPARKKTGRRPSQPRPPGDAP